MRRLRTIMLFCLLAGGVSAQTAGTVVHGYGGRSCGEYLDTWRRWDGGDERGVLDYFGYQQWFAGMVTAMSLATGQDVLRGSDVEGLMRRVEIRCQDNRGQTAFEAASAHLRDLSQLP